MQTGMVFHKAVHLIKCLHTSLPYNIQILVLQQHLIIQIQHGNIDGICTQRPSENKQHLSLQILTLPWSWKEMQTCHSLGHVLFQCQPHRVPTNQAFLLPWKALNCGVQYNKHHICKMRENPIRKTWNRVLLLDCKLDAIDKLCSKANRERDVSTCANDDVGFEIDEFFVTRNHGFDQM